MHPAAADASLARVQPLGRTFGPFTLHTYGLLLAIAFLAGLWVASRRPKRAGARRRQRVTDMAVWVLIAGLIGAKLLLRARGLPLLPAAARASSPRIFQSGGVFYGGLIGGAARRLVVRRAATAAAAGRRPTCSRRASCSARRSAGSAASPPAAAGASPRACPGP